MFTGIVEEKGKIIKIQRNADSMILRIKGKKVLENTGIGDSICTNGICLTVTSIDDKSFSADVMPETVYRTSLENLELGMEVNLERASSTRFLSLNSCSDRTLKELLSHKKYNSFSPSDRL